MRRPVTSRAEIGHASLGVAVAAYERWLDGDGELRTLLDDVFRALEAGLDRTVHLRPSGG
jgi:MftR C-terminal domain